MKDWHKKAEVLWTIIGLLSAGLIYFISLVRSYEPEISRLRLENMKQDSVIAFQEIDIERLNKKIKNEFDNIYDVFHYQNKKLKEVSGQ